MKNNIKKILKVFIPCFIIGFLFGFCASVFDFDKIVNSIMNGDLTDLIVKVSPYILIISGALLSIITISIIFYVKKNLDVDNEKILTKMEKTLDWGLLTSNFLLISNMILFGIATNTMSNSLIFVTIAFFLVYLFIASLCQIVIVNLVKKINPEKKGDVMDKHFQKDWLNSCDEAQKAMIYEASYKAFQFMSAFLAFLLNILIILNIISNIVGIVPIIIVGLIYLVHIMCYTYFAMKLEYK